MMMSQWVKDSNPSHFPALKTSLFKTRFESNLQLCHQLAVSLFLTLSLSEPKFSIPKVEIVLRIISEMR